VTSLACVEPGVWAQTCYGAACRVCEYVPALASRAACEAGSGDFTGKPQACYYDKAVNWGFGAGCQAFDLYGASASRGLYIAAGKTPDDFLFPRGEEEIIVTVTITVTDPPGAVGTSDFRITVKMVDDMPFVEGLDNTKTYPGVWNEAILVVTDTETSPADITVFAETSDPTVIEPQNLKCLLDPTNTSQRILRFMASDQGFADLLVMVSDGFQTIPALQASVTVTLPPFSEAVYSAADGAGTRAMQSGINGAFVVTTADVDGFAKRVGGDTVEGRLELDPALNPRQLGYHFKQTTFAPVDTTGLPSPIYVDTWSEISDAVDIGFAFPFYGTSPCLRPRALYHVFESCMEVAWRVARRLYGGLHAEGCTRA
jgi:hypothetical protein